jgi:Tfp pilus assembly protein PilO
MSRNDRMLLLALPILAVLLGFYIMVLSPKQDKAKKLDAQVTQLRNDLQTQQAEAQKGLAARKNFPRDYHRLVVMGKAVPVDDETASLIVQINRIATNSGVSFRKIDLAQSTSTASSVAPTTAPTTATGAPTETAASLMPIGATIGSANLPVLPYSLSFHGNYFQIADFMAGIDSLVSADKGRIQADGRLVTIDAFKIAPPQDGSGLDADLSVTTFVTPADQGLTAGATPAGPTAATTTAAPASSTTTSAPATTTTPTSP